MKVVILLFVRLLSFILSLLGITWMVVSYINYLVKNTQFNMWSIWSTIIFSVVCIVASMLYGWHKFNQASKKPERKSKFEERLEDMQKKRNYSLGVTNSFPLITEQEVIDHCRKSDGSEYMCKNCGSTFNSLAVSKNYCHGCNCWLCYKCSDERCGECRTKN